MPSLVTFGSLLIVPYDDKSCFCVSCIRRSPPVLDRPGSSTDRICRLSCFHLYNLAFRVLLLHVLRRLNATGCQDSVSNTQQKYIRQCNKAGHHQKVLDQADEMVSARKPKENKKRQKKKKKKKKERKRLANGRRVVRSASRKSKK